MRKCRSGSGVTPPLLPTSIALDAFRSEAIAFPRDRLDAKLLPVAANQVPAVRLIAGTGRDGRPRVRDHSTPTCNGVARRGGDGKPGMEVSGEEEIDPKLREAPHRQRCPHDERELTVNTRRRWARVSIDGEVRRMEPPLNYRIRPGALRVLCPASAAE